MLVLMKTRIEKTNHTTNSVDLIIIDFLSSAITLIPSHWNISITIRLMRHGQSFISLSGSETIECLSMSPHCNTILSIVSSSEICAVDYPDWNTATQTARKTVLIAQITPNELVT